MTAVITATWVIVALVVVVGLLGVALVIVGDDHERPVPTPKVNHYDMRADGRLVPVPSPIVELIDRHPHVQQPDGRHLPDRARRRLPVHRVSFGDVGGAPWVR